MAAALSCSGDRAPTPFPVRAGIPLGHVTILIGHIEPADPDLPGGRTDPEDRAYAMYVSCSGLPSVDAPGDRREYFSHFLERQLWMVDADGTRFRPRLAIPEQLYEPESPLPYSEDRYWVVVFVLPEVSRDFTLMLRNPDPQAQQPEVASVHLGTPGAG